MQTQPKYAIGQKVQFEITFSATGIVQSSPVWDDDDKTYQYELTEIETEQTPTNLNLYVDKFTYEIDGVASIFLEEDLEDPEAEPSQPPSCEFEPA